jgi:hypothetical protein
MRILDIVLFLMLFSLVTGLMDSTCWFSGGAMPMEDLNITKAELENLNAATSSVESGAIGTAAGAIKAAWTATIFILNMLFRVVYIQDIIYGIFASGLAPDSPDRAGIQQIAWLIQAGVWFMYSIGIYQLWSKTSTAHMQ